MTSVLQLTKTMQAGCRTACSSILKWPQGARAWLLSNSHRALAVVALANPVDELTSTAQLHDDMHVGVILEDCLQVDHIERATQLAEDGYLALDVVQVLLLLASSDVRDVQLLGDALAGKLFARLLAGYDLNAAEPSTP
jgi:hypothetical protein